MDAHAPVDPRSAARGAQLVLLCMLELMGIIPFVGLLIMGAWDQGELGFGTLTLLLVTPELVRTLRAGGRAPPCSPR